MPLTLYPHGVHHLNNLLMKHCLVFEKQLKEINSMDRKFIHCFSRSRDLVFRHLLSIYSVSGIILSVRDISSLCS